jgi:hypothetical protein
MAAAAGDPNSDCGGASDPLTVPNTELVAETVALVVEALVAVGEPNGVVDVADVTGRIDPKTEVAAGTGGWPNTLLPPKIDILGSPPKMPLLLVLVMVGAVMSFSELVVEVTVDMVMLAAMVIETVVAVVTASGCPKINDLVQTGMWPGWP